MFGKEFKVLKEVKLIFKIVGDDYPECFCAYGEENGKLEYCIIDDNFCQPSPANYCDTNGAGGGFKPTVELFTSTGWERYATPLALPCKKCDEKYYYIDVYNKIGYKINIDSEFDCERYKTYNYFMYETIAQYVADKQLIQRIRITLTLLNKENPDREMLISEYINDNYKDVIDRIKRYENK